MPSNFWAVLSVLAFLGTVALVGVGVCTALFGAIRGHRVLLRRSLQATGALVLVYGAALGVVSLMSRETVLPPGSEKYFCELDCHLAYQVERVEAAGPVEQGAARWRVWLRTRFDERTISPARGRDAPLWPNPRRILVIGTDGRAYPVTSTVAASDTMRSTPITTELRPGESYDTGLSFVLPPGVTPARLSVSEDGFVNRVIIGHERSFFHRPVLFSLEGSPGQVSTAYHR